MTPETVTLLRAAIRDEQAFFDAPPPALLAGLDLAPAAPLTVRFGPDVESYIVKDNKNVFGMSGLTEDSPLFDRDFFNDIDRALRDILFHPARHEQQRAVFLDGSAVEIRLAPASAPDICDAFLRARHYIGDAVRERGATFYGGAGHWHVSLTQGPRDLLGMDHTHRQATAGLLIYQTLFPAFFISPHIAEAYSGGLPGGGLRYKGAKEIVTNYGPSGSLCHKFHSASGLYTIENRLAVHAPYLPVYMTMAAIRYGLTREGRLPGHGLDSPPFLPRHNEQRAQILGTAGHYLSMIAQTAASQNRYGLIPAPLFKALLAESIRGYGDYLSWPRVAQHYGAEKIEKIRDDLSRITGHDAPRRAPAPS